MQCDQTNEKTISYELELNRLDSIISFLWLPWLDGESSGKTVSSSVEHFVQTTDCEIYYTVNNYLLA